MTDETRAKVREALKAAKDAQGRVRREKWKSASAAAEARLSRQETALAVAIAALEMV